MTNREIRIGCFLLLVLGASSMPLNMRLASLSAFRTDPVVCALLVSLKAGGEGLNLQVASHVLLIDPWWNPAVELQAIQRTHRIGVCVRRAFVSLQSGVYGLGNGQYGTGHWDPQRNMDIYGTPRGLGQNTVVPCFKFMPA